ncbi:MAG: hypothetical protein ACOYMN_01585 [Roseimicrobium sp.]
MTHAETRTVTFAIAGSLAVHTFLALVFALFMGATSWERAAKPKPKIEPKPQVTLVFPATPPPKPTPPPQKEPDKYIRTTQNTAAPTAPAKTDFISDKNTVASTTVAPSPEGNKPMPTMTGVDFPTNELMDRKHRDGETKNDSAPASAPAPPTPAPPAPPKPQPKLEPMVAKKEDSPAERMMKEFDEAQPKPKAPTEAPAEIRKAQPAPDVPPTMRAPEDSAVPSAIPEALPPKATPVETLPRPEKDAFQPETHRGAVKGTLSNRGKENSVAAAATPVGRYIRQVTGAVEKKWHQYRVARADAVEPGKMGLRFFVNKFGKVEDIEFLFKEANALMEDFTIEAILKADIPPIPSDLLLILEKERVEITYDIVIHP